MNNSYSKGYTSTPEAAKVEHSQEVRRVEDYVKSSAVQEALGFDCNLVSIVHDICAKDVRLICQRNITHSFLLPGVNGLGAGCRGGRVITTPFPAECFSVRITCAEESLGADCMSVENVIGVEIVLRSLQAPYTYYVINDTITFSCTRFYTVPIPCLVEGEALADALRFIDGSCKVIVIRRCEVVMDAACPRVELELQVADKLWKHENLLVLAAAPFPRENITVCQVFNDLHRIGPCPPDECPPPAKA